MDTVNSDDIAARVVAWHNRHPLAQRITPAQVDGIGVVALPFVWTVSWRRKPVERPAFDEDFAPPLPRWRIARFATQQATAQRPGPADWPQREIPLKAAVAAKAGTAAPATPEAPAQRYLLTAAIEVNGQRKRLLLSPAAAGRVIGPRAWARRRIAVVSAAVLPMLVLFGAAAWMLAAPMVTQSPVQAASASAVAVASAVAIAVAPMASATLTASAPMATPSAVLAASASTSGPGETGVVGDAVASVPLAADDMAVAAAAPTTSFVRPEIRPLLSDEARQAARRDSALARQQTQASAPPGSDSATSRVYALTATPQQQRALAQAQLARMRVALAAVPTHVTTQARLFQVKGQWQAAWWPLFDRESAVAAQSLLARQGMQVQVVEF